MIDEQSRYFTNNAYQMTSVIFSTTFNNVIISFLSLQETYIVHDFESDFYGKQLKLCICGYLRPEKNFDSMDSLIEAINNDIKNAKEQLDTEPFASYQFNDFFKN